MPTYQIEVLAHLMNQALADHVVVLRIARIAPVVEQSPEHATALPPEVGLPDDTGVATVDVPAIALGNSIVGPEFFGDVCRCILD